jgi:uncharacterized protein
VVAAGVGVAALVVGLAGPAATHVSVNPKEAAKGSFAKLTFRVPNERDNASTVKVEVAFPTDHPIANVSVRPVPGWTAVLTRTKLAKPLDDGEGGTIDETVSLATWSGGVIKPGEFQEFDVSVGPLPKDVDKLVFKAVQTYDNGEVVRWIEEAAAGTAEPEHPAPVLTLTAAASDDHHDTASATDSESGDNADTLARALGAAGLALGVIALVLAFTARRGPRPGAGAGAPTP